MSERPADRHAEPERFRHLLPLCEQPSYLTGERAAPGVVLDRQLTRGHPEDLRRLGIEDLLYPLELNEVVRWPDRAESEAGQMERKSRKLAPQPLHAAVWFEVKTAALLYARQRLRVQAISLYAELRAALGAAEYVPRGKLPAPCGRVRVAASYFVEEAPQCGLARGIDVEREQCHPAVDRGAGELGPDGSERGDGDAGGHLEVMLMVEVRQDHGGSSEVYLSCRAVQRAESLRVRGCAGAVEDPGRHARDALRRTAEQGHVHAFIPSMVRCSASRVPWTADSSTRTQRSRPAKAAAVWVTCGCGGPIPVPRASNACTPQ